MFVLKPVNKSGRFVDNLRNTTKTLTSKCREVPKTAIPSKPTFVNYSEYIEVEVDIEDDVDFILDEL